MLQLLKKLLSKSVGSASSEPPVVYSGSNQESSQSEVEAQESYRPPQTISEAYANPRYQNKIVIESREGLFSTTQSERAVKEFKKLQDRYPDEPPVMTVIPKGTVVSVPTNIDSGEGT